jgi:serine/threonine protein kinase
MPEQSEWIDDVADRFEAAWKQGPPPRLGNFLGAATGDRRLALLEELLKIDLAYRWRNGDRRNLEDYLDEFPELIGPGETLPDRLVLYADRLREPLSETARPPEPGTLLPPLPVVPGYEVLGVLGRGGMGVVYRAWQAGLNRLVALKLIKAGVDADEAELDRFKAEAEAVARLQHPNIVQIHEVGEHHGLPFFSLEYCPGGSLDRKLAGTPLPPAEAARLDEVLARAMHAAHQKGLIHRDLKPANVLFAEDGTPKITDFGLAKKLDEAGQTQSGAIMGTPSYMAPEQARGASKQVGPAADVWALGATLYECLTGHPPFKAATAMDTIMQVLNEEPCRLPVCCPTVRPTWRPSA